MATPTNATPPANATPPTNPTTEHTRRHVVETVRGFTRRIPRARAHVHAASTLGGRHARSQAPAVSHTTSTNVALAGLQLVIGYQWLVSGIDKVLLGTVPAQIRHLLVAQIGSSDLPGYFAKLLPALVVPN